MAAVGELMEFFFFFEKREGERKKRLFFRASLFLSLPRAKTKKKKKLSVSLSRALTSSSLATCASDPADVPEPSLCHASTLAAPGSVAGSRPAALQSALASSVSFRW